MVVELRKQKFRKTFFEILGGSSHHLQLQSRANQSRVSQLHLQISWETYCASFHFDIQAANQIRRNPVFEMPRTDC
jgi:hypothetical protein